MISVGINYSWGREEEALGRDDRGRDLEDWNCPEVRPTPCRTSCGSSESLLMIGSVIVRLYELWLEVPVPQMSR